MWKSDYQRVSKFSKAVRLLVVAFVYFGDRRNLMPIGSEGIVGKCKGEERDLSELANSMAPVN